MGKKLEVKEVLEVNYNSVAVVLGEVSWTHRRKSEVVKDDLVNAGRNLEVLHIED